MTQPVKQWAVTNADKSQTVITYQWDPPPPADPPPPPPPMLVGSAAAPNNILSGHPTYPGQQIGLAFHSPTKGLVPTEIAVAKKVGCLPVSCYKDDPTPALLKTYLDAVYAAGIEAWLNLDQEVNANHYRTASVYKSLVAQQLDIVAAHPAGKAGLVTCVEKFSYFQGVSAMEDYWTGLCDGVLFDRYAPAGYTPPDVLFAECEQFAAKAGAAAKLAGRPFFWGVGEHGVTQQTATDPSGQGQADALATNVGHIQAAGGRCVLVWDGPGTEGRVYTCSTPARAGWRGLTLAARAAAS